MTAASDPAGETWRLLLRRTSEAVVDPVQARWLVEEASGLDRVALLRELDQSAPKAGAERLATMVKRRLAGEPLQHVLGHWGFRRLDVAVDRRVLVPRPETEHVVTVALRELDRLSASGSATGSRAASAAPGLLAVDLGTGSGVIALSLVCEREAVRVVATDRDPAAVEVTSGNLSRLPAEAAARVELRLGDWYLALPSELAGRVDLIVSNPPYVAGYEWPELEPTVREFDPVGALVAGPTGLEAVEAIVAGAPEWLAPHGALVVEIAPHQALEATELARSAGLVSASIEEDLAGRARMLVASR